ncbi:MAG: GtrA family protein [Kiritimatiellae bacterium]|nr:GtrA family protein [Kiritimatiellia bacterium]
MGGPSGFVAFVRKVLSHECGPFWQFVKYGAIGVMATLVQMAFFYLCASTFLRCLAPGDWAVEALSLPAAEFTGGEPWFASRWFLAAAATAIGFTVANVFCWLMNRWFVFRPGRFRWYVEFGMFYSAAALATFIALSVQSLLIAWCGMMTSAAVVIEVLVSFMVNFFVRKFLIFRG